MNPTPPKIHTLADLQNWKTEGVPLALIGHPVAHTLSPQMHNAALAAMTKKVPPLGEWSYHVFDILPGQLLDALTLFHKKHFCGVNITVPHKIQATDFVTEITPEARLVGAVNTLERMSIGWRGHTTDPRGLSEGISESLKIQLKFANVLLLGAGGAAHAAAVECLRLRCSSLWIANRTTERRDMLLSQLKAYAQMQDIPMRALNLDKLPSDFPKNALIINATSLGLKDGDPLPVELDKLPRPRAVFDMIYNPLETPLLRQAAAMGIPRANGLSMLVHQGARALEIWTREKVPVQVMSEAVSPK